MRIALVTHRLTKGDGQGRVNYEIALAALDAGHQVCLVATHIAAELRSHPLAESVRIGVSGWPSILIKNQIFALKSALWLARNRRRFDVVHVNGFITWGRADVNTSHFVHNAWLRSPVHTWRTRRDWYGFYQWVFTRLNSALELWAYRRAPIIVAVSEQVRRELIAAGLDCGRIRVVANGVDLNEFFPGTVSRAELGLPEGILLLFVGDIRTSRKNLDTVLRALVSVPGVTLLVVGEVPGSPYPRLARELGIAERVRFLGFRRDIPLLMRATDLFVFPSRYEACSLVLLEALASGLPIISAASTGGSELLTSECSVLIDDPDDVAALAAAINSVASSTDLRYRMRATARTVAGRHAWSAMAERYLDIYQETQRSTGLLSSCRPGESGPRRSLGIVICTMDRPRELLRCLDSIFGCTLRPDEIIVSDDGQRNDETHAVCTAFPMVRYFPGPRRGLCANRNAAIDHATSDFVSLLDDDVIVRQDFVERAFAIISALPPRTLVTGTAIDAGRPVIPNNPSFLGFFGRTPNGRFRNINLISNVLPRGAFQEARFDEILSYGYEDMDLCTRLLARGYADRHEPGLVTTHLPPPRSAALNKERRAQAERARFYTSVKRYLIYERSAGKLLAFIAIAPVHRALHAVRMGKWRDVPAALADIWFAVCTGLRERARHRRGEPSSMA